MTIRMGNMGDVDWEVGAFFDELAGPPMYSNPYAMQRAPFPPPQYGGFPARRVVPSIPGAPAIGAKLQPLGFSAVAFTATSGTALPATTRPQKPFKGRRLVVDFTRTGATATGLLTITSINIGVNNQLVSTQPIGAAAFSPNAFDCNVSLSACSSALDITVNYALSVAPTMTDRIDVATTLFGETVGS
jgi:hypothetical protein